MATGTVCERVLCVYSVTSSLRPLRSRLPAPSCSADGKSEAQRSDGHRHLEGMELGFTAGLEGRHRGLVGGPSPSRSEALEGGRAPGKPGKGVLQHAGGHGAVGKGLPLGGNKPGAEACQPEPPPPQTPQFPGGTGPGLGDSQAVPSEGATWAPPGYLCARHKNECGTRALSEFQ